MVKRIKLSIVVPAFNEAKIIKKSLRKIFKYLSSQKYTWEIVVSDDGSVDKTPEIVKGFRNKKLRLVRSAENQGKGGALKKGILASSGDHIIFMDADLSVPLSNIKHFLEVLEKEGGVATASRRVKGAKILVHQPWHRETMGRVFTFLSRITTNTNILDFTCGFKGFTRESAKDIFTKSLIKRWAYDTEILFLAKKMDYPIRELPVFWRNRADTRVRLTGVIFETLLDLAKIRINDIFRRYD